MAINKQLHTVDTLWDLVCAPENDDKRFYLIDGELFGEDVLPGFELEMTRLFRTS